MFMSTTRTFNTCSSWRRRLRTATPSSSFRPWPAGRSAVLTAESPSRVPATRLPVAASILDAIGNTPVVELRRLNPYPDIRLLAKLEGANPSGSVKDRVAKYLVAEFESRADSPDYILLEPTSGNTGIALAMVSRVKGYRVSLPRSEEHTSELQSRQYLVCRLLLEKKKNKQ